MLTRTDCGPVKLKVGISVGDEKVRIPRTRMHQLCPSCKKKSIGQWGLKFCFENMIAVELMLAVVSVSS